MSKLGNRRFPTIGFIDSSSTAKGFYKRKQEYNGCKPGKPEYVVTLSYKAGHVNHNNHTVHELEMTFLRDTEEQAVKCAIAIALRNQGAYDVRIKSVYRKLSSARPAKQERKEVA
jgi:hypothetical protein